MLGDAGVTCGDLLVCFFISHARLRALSARPAFPAPSDFEGSEKTKNFAQNMQGSMSAAK
jgi:hypothetical protein